MLKISPLFSGSKGNCTLVQSDSVNILLDVGYNYKSIVSALAARRLAARDITAIVITHEHSDHIGALPLWTKHDLTPVFAPQPIVDTVRSRGCLSQVQGVDESGLVVGDVHISVYKCSHDAACCFGYKFACGNSRFACVTDTGYPDNALAEFLCDCQAVMLESNHDEDMLRRGEYSYSLKRRILSRQGHLSNAQAAQVIKKLVGTSVRTLVLAHLSENNNTQELAFNSAVAACASCGAVEGRDVDIYVANQYQNGVTICLD